MQQEYTPYGPEWAKEVKKLTKDQIINDFLRPALLKAKAEPGGRSAGTWVKASERLPWHKAHWNTGKLGSDENSFPVRMNGRYSMGDIYDQAGKGESEIPMINVRGVGDVYSDQFHLLEWLDEGTLPDNKDREIAFGKWVGKNGYYYDETLGWMDEKDNVWNDDQMYALWEQSLTNKP